MKKLFRIGRRFTLYWCPGRPSRYLDLQRLVPRRHRYATVDFWSVWRFELSVQPKYKSEAEYMKATWGLAEWPPSKERTP